MPWKIVRDHPDCPPSKPVGVVNEESGKVAALTVLSIWVSTLLVR